MIVKNVSGKIVWLLIVSLVLSIVSLSTYTWGRYIFFLVAVMVGLVYTVRNRGKFKLKYDMFQKLLIAFALYTGASSLWAMNMSDSIEKMVTLISIAICYYPIYAYYRDCGTVEQLVSGIKWGGTAVCLYTISFTGLDVLMRAASAENLRIASEFANANTLGLCAATVIFLQIWQSIFAKGKRWEIICCVPSLLVIGATQSKKAILLLVVSVFLLFFLRYGFGKKPLKTFMTLILAVAIVIGMVYVASQSEIFSGLFERIQVMINTLTGVGTANYSTQVRLLMMKYGIEWWLQKPFFGYGVGNPHILARQYINYDAYLHNNYVELLCGGGMIGFTLYYAMHINVISKLSKLRDTDKPLFSLGFAWCILMLIMDFAMVSYYSKLDLFYLMTVFLIVEQMKSEKNEIMESKQ